VSTTRLFFVSVLFAGLSCRSSPYREVDIDLGAPAGDEPPSTGAPAARTLRFSVAAMQSPRATHAAYARLIARIGRLVGVPVELVQRRTYVEVNDLLLAGQIDVAFVCTGGYLDLKRRAAAAVSLVAVPVMDGKTTYQSLIIVPGASRVTRVEDLAGKRFAFTDALSFTGHAYPRHFVRAMGRAPAEFFGNSFFTQSHDRSIQAVARGLADGAAVDSLIFDSLAKADPGLARAARVIHRSPPFGIPPVVASRRSADLEARIREVLLGLHQDAEAVLSLRELHVDRFATPDPGMYDAAEVVMKDNGR
jgi:phosphonate transport system substrate-binding protein